MLYLVEITTPVARSPYMSWFLLDDRGDRNNLAMMKP